MRNLQTTYSHIDIAVSSAEWYQQAIINIYYYLIHISTKKLYYKLY